MRLWFLPVVLLGAVFWASFYPSISSAQEQCSLTVASVESVTDSGTLGLVQIGGRAIGCDTVDVQLACLGLGRTQRVPVEDGRWTVGFSPDDARAEGCTCRGRIDVKVVCFEQETCADRALQALECNPPRLLAFQHAVAFICGKAPEGVAAAGIYSTAINVHNPSGLDVSFRKKFAVGEPEQRSGPITSFFPGRLRPDGAMEIDCPEIMKRTGRQGFVKGFAVIESDATLDVVTIYSAAGRDGMVSTMDVLSAVPRRRERCSGPDLVVETILQPVWNSLTQTSMIQVVVRNVGDAPAEKSAALVRDPSTTNPDTDQPHQSGGMVPALSPGGSAAVTLQLPYWVYNPDATLEVVADYKETIPECDEMNNVGTFNDRG